MVNSFTTLLEVCLLCSQMEEGGYSMGKLTANIPEELHQKVRDEVAADESLTTSMVVQRAIEAYYSKGENKMNESTGRSHSRSRRDCFIESRAIWPPSGSRPARS